jgi:hypothetical protein
LAQGRDILAHEYFIVAVADLTEARFVEHHGATPSIISRGVADLVYRDLPFDVKNTAIPTGWSADAIERNPAAFAASMLQGADPGRHRSPADHPDLNGWGFNRIFVVTADENRWLRDIDGLLEELGDQIAHLGAPLIVPFGERRAHCHVLLIRG